MSELSVSGLFDNVYSVSAVRAIDRAAIDGGIPGYTLMTRAADAALRFAQEQFPATKHWQVLCGGGNNGGDGYVLARLARDSGFTVDVLSLAPPDTLTGDAKTAYDDFTASGGKTSPWAGTLDERADLLVDALLGSGLQREVSGDYAAAVEAMNAHWAPILALDIPTGLHGDTGEVMGVSVWATATLTFVGYKAGSFLRAGPERCGVLALADLAIPERRRDGVEGAYRRLTAAGRRRLLKPRARDSHKGSHGHVAIVGGGPGMPGAVAITGTAALRAGCGLVSAVTHANSVAAIVAARPEIMCHAVETPENAEEVLARADIIAIGPGLGRDPWARALFSAVLALDKPLVIDADALNLLAEAPRRGERWILTPHPGEAGRLLGVDTKEIQKERDKALAELRERYAATVILKGANTLVSARDAGPWLCSAGNPGMASAGMGDALTGIVAAFVAQGMAAEDAAVLAVDVHARAGDAAARAGERGLLASDLIEELRAWVNA